MSTIHENKQDNCILEDDLEYPKYLYNLHNDYPFSPEKIEIKENMLSDYHRKIANKYNISVSGVKKLLPSLGNKSKYVSS